MTKLLRRSMGLSLVSMGFFGGSPNLVRAQQNTLVTGWTFDTLSSGTTLVPANLGLFTAGRSLFANGTNGSSLLTGTEPNSFGGTATNDPRSPTVAGNAFAIRKDSAATEGKSIVFSSSTIGLSGIGISYATQYSSSSGFTTQSWEYSTNGTTYSFAGTISGYTGSFSARSLDLSAITALDNAANVYFRVTFTGSTSALGTNNRIDNFRVGSTSWTWFGASSTAFATPANYAGSGLAGPGTIPATDGNLVFAPQTIANNPDIGATSRTLARISYLNGTSATTFNGTADLVIRDGVRNYSLNTQTIAAPVALSGDSTFDAANAGLIFSGSISGTNAVTIAGTQTVSFDNINNAYGGVTNVNGGTLSIIGTLSAGGGLVTVGSGGTLAGTGTINRAVTVNGVVSPGVAGAGVLAISGPTIVNNIVDITATTAPAASTRLAVTGSINLPTGSAFRISGALDGTSSYLIATYTTSLDTLATISGASTATNISMYSLDYSVSGQISLVPVPEPTTLLGFAALGLAGVRLRRRAV